MGLFYELGKSLGPSFRKGRWIWQSLTGSDREIIEAETSVGRDLSEALLRELPPDPDPLVADLVGETGRALTACVKNRLRTFEFHVVRAAEANAFALPGGHVFVTRALLDLVEGDAASVAFILGHEMGHVIKKHAMERVMTDAALGAALRALPAARAAGDWVRKTGATLLTSAHSQDREYQADELGVALAEAAGFEPRGAVRVLRQLATVTTDRGIGCEYFSSHPPAEERVAAIERWLGKRRR